MELPDEIKEKAKEGLLTIGAESTLKALKNKQLSRIVITKNCKKEIIDNIQNHKGDTEVVMSDIGSDELGIICKKQFNISVIGFKTR